MSKDSPCLRACARHQSTNDQPTLYTPPHRITAVGTMSLDCRCQQKRGRLCEHGGRILMRRDAFLEILGRLLGVIFTVE